MGKDKLSLTDRGSRRESNKIGIPGGCYQSFLIQSALLRLLLIILIKTAEEKKTTTTTRHVALTIREVPSFSTCPVIYTLYNLETECIVPHVRCTWSVHHFSCLKMFFTSNVWHQKFQVICNSNQFV